MLEAVAFPLLPLRQRRFSRRSVLCCLRDQSLQARVARFHAVLHSWLSGGRKVEDLDAFNRRVYAELFLTPRSDPWLGLVSPETFMAWEPREQR